VNFHCDFLLKDAHLPAVSFEGVDQGQNGLWAKAVAAFKYLHGNFKDEYDWIMKVEDFT